MSVRSTYRFVNFTTTKDPIGEETWAAVCVSGDEKECGARSKDLGGDEDANDWMAEHASETGHERFKRVFSDYAIVRPKQP